MIRIFSFILIILFCVSCTHKNQAPVLSGILWGGEGNMLIIKSVLDKSDSYDTLFIDHMGEFAWTPDTIISGLYRLENIYQEGVTLLLDPNKQIGRASCRERV